MAALSTTKFVEFQPMPTDATGRICDGSPAGLTEHLERTRGPYAVHATRHAHWKYFWFD
jgi:hypothetical protein